MRTGGTGGPKTTAARCRHTTARQVSHRPPAPRRRSNHRQKGRKGGRRRGGGGRNGHKPGSAERRPRCRGQVTPPSGVVRAAPPRPRAPPQSLPTRKKNKKRSPHAAGTAPAHHAAANGNEDARWPRLYSCPHLCQDAKAPRLRVHRLHRSVASAKRRGRGHHHEGHGGEVAVWQIRHLDGIGEAGRVQGRLGRAGGAGMAVRRHEGGRGGPRRGKAGAWGTAQGGERQTETRLLSACPVRSQ